MIIEPLNENHRFERLVQKLAPTSKLLRVWALKGGISAEMTAIEIETPDGKTKRMIVRRPSAAALKHNPQAAHDEFKLLQYLHSLGLAAPQPYHLDHTGQIFPTPALVTEYIEGAMQFAPADSDNLAWFKNPEN